MTEQVRISDTGELETVPTTWDGEPLYSPATVQEGLFSADAFEQMPGQMAMTTEARRCYCPDDCNCHHLWRPNYCGCKGHDDDMWRPRASEALCDALDELASEGEIQGWRHASDLETRSLWRVVVSLPGCEQKMDEQQGWTLVRNCRELRP